MREREERNERCIGDVEIGWLRGETRTALLGSASFGPEVLRPGQTSLTSLGSRDKGH